MRSIDLPVVPEIDAVRAFDAVRNGRAVIVDVREPEELDEVAIPDAICIPLGSLQAAIAEVPRDRDVLMLCRSGARSAYATQFLLLSGFERVWNISGGVIAWAELDLPIIVGGELVPGEDPLDSNS